MEANTVLVLSMFITFIALLFTGIPIAYILGGVAMLFSLVGYLSDMYLGTMTGLDFNTLGMAAERAFQIVENWVLLAIPMFLFMGLMLDASGTAQRMMKSMQELFGPLRGGLAVSVAVIGIILAASTGIVGASVVLLAIISMPTMLNQKYSPALAAGTVAASGTLGILIPPSIMLIIMGDQLSIPVGDLFLGAMLPGCLLGGLYIVYIILYSWLKPDAAPLAPDRRKVTWPVFWEVLKSALPPFGLIILVLGSIFTGLATPTEAGGVAVFGATALAAINRKLTWKVIKKVTLDTFSTCGFVFSLMVGATLFALVLRLLGGDEVIDGFFASLSVGPYGKVAIIMASVFFLGFFLDWIEICLIILPLVAPVVQALGVDVNGYGVVDQPTLVWFSVLVAIALQTSFLTPPVGPSIFFVQGVAPKEVKLSHIYKGVVPFIILQLIGLFMVIVWPALVTWLPAVIYK